MCICWSFLILHESFLPKLLSHFFFISLQFFLSCSFFIFPPSPPLLSFTSLPFNSLSFLIFSPSSPALLLILPSLPLTFPFPLLSYPYFTFSPLLFSTFILYTNTLSFLPPLSPALPHPFPVPPCSSPSVPYLPCRFPFLPCPSSPPLCVLVLRVAPVNDDVALLQQGDQLLDETVHCGAG